MITINQYNRKKRKKKIKTNRVKLLTQCPQLKGECIKVFFGSPKKPNSAVRKLAKVLLSNDKVIIAAIPGQGHKLQEHSNVLVRGGRLKDVPGVKFKLIKGKYDLGWNESIHRMRSRSKYGVPKNFEFINEFI